MWGKLNIDPVCVAICILALQGLIIPLYTTNSQKMPFFIDIYGSESCSHEPATGSSWNHSTTPKLKDLF